MSILAGKLDALLQRFEDCQVDPALIAELRAAFELAAGLDDYVGRWTTPESNDLAELARRTAAQDWTRAPGDTFLEQEMLSGHVEGQALKMLVHATQATRVLEIGMFTGYSALAMAEALPPNGQIVACELDAEVAAFAQQSFDMSADGSKIVVRVGPALHTIQELADHGAVFDLVFIDADKAGYAGYLNAVLDNCLLDTHGLICVDNTLMQGQPWIAPGSNANGDAIADFNRTVAADPRIEQVIIPLRDGLTLIRRVDLGPDH